MLGTAWLRFSFQLRRSASRPRLAGVKQHFQEFQAGEGKKKKKKKATVRAIKVPPGATLQVRQVLIRKSAGAAAGCAPAPSQGRLLHREAGQRV